MKVSEKVIIFIKNVINSLLYATYLIFHPFDGFWDLKHEDRGNTAAATIILLMVTITYVIMRLYTGFIFNLKNIEDLNVLQEFMSIVIPFALWSLVNWSLTTLMEGKGTPRNIYIASAFALTPVILVNLPLTAISHFLTLEEGSFFYFFLSLGVIWMAILLFISTMVTHDYDIGKTVFTIILILAGIIISLFLGLLFLSLINQVIGFVSDIYKELTFRL